MTYQFKSSLRMLAALVVVLGANAFTALVSPVEAAARVNKHAVAVIIGNKAYRDKTPTVDYAHNDAAAMKRYVLEVLGYRAGNIIDLRDATKAEMEATFGNNVSHQGRLFDWVRPGKSDVFIFYSGHGVPGLKDRRPYLLPVDGNANLAEISGFSVDTLYQNLAQVPARSMTVLLDACFSGETPKGMIVRATSGLSISAKLPESTPTTMTVLTAAQGDQFASWDEEQQHGLFTRYVLDALYGAADGNDFGNGDGKITLAEVQAYLDDEMSYHARRKYGRQQRASVIGDETLNMGSVVPGGRPQVASRSVAQPTPRKVAKPAPVARPQPVQPTPKVARRTSPATPSPAIANRKLGKFELNLITFGGADVCEKLNAYLKVFVSETGFKGKGQGVMGVSGKFRESKDRLIGEFYSATMTGEFSLKFDGRKWSGTWEGTSVYNGFDCDGTVTLTRK